MDKLEFLLEEPGIDEVVIPEVDNERVDAESLDRHVAVLSLNPVVEEEDCAAASECLVVDGEAEDATPGCDPLLDLAEKLFSL